ncbi:MAG: hypothetical protein AAF741_01770 [Bacteroidota bacterium]
MSKRRSRQSELSRLATQLNMTYHAGEHNELISELRDFRTFSKGFRRRKKIRHMLRRQDGMLDYDLRIFDFHRLKGKNKRPESQTVFYLRSKDLVLPQFWLRPETVLHKLGELLGRGDIDFVRFPKFSGRYRLTGDDEVFIRHHFNDELLHFFSVEKGWYAEGVGYYLILFQKGKLLSAKKIKELYEKGMYVYGELAKGT